MPTELCERSESTIDGGDNELVGRFGVAVQLSQILEEGRILSLTMSKVAFASPRSATGVDDDNESDGSQALKANIEE